MPKSPEPLESHEWDLYTLEYERIGAAVSENESMGEGRVALYFGVWSAAAAGVGAIRLSVYERAISALAVVALGVVLALGIVTLLRIVKRNHHTDELVDSLERLRTLLGSGGFPRFEAALPWRKKDQEQRSALLHAGLLHAVYLANAVVPALAIVAVRCDAELLWGAALIACAWSAQVFLVAELNRGSLEKRQAKSSDFEKTTEQNP